MRLVRYVMILVTLLIAACTPQPTAAPVPGTAPAGEQRSDNQVLRIGTTLGVSHFGPETFYFVPFLHWPVYDLITQFGPNYEVRPSVAMSWQLSNDRLTWTFTIRDDMTFSNGDKLTAEDVAFTIRTALKEFWPLTSFMLNVTGATAVNPTTVNVSLSRPDVTIPNIMAMQFVVPMKYYEAVGAQAFRQKPVGSGPYEVAEFRSNDLVRYRLRGQSHPFRKPANTELVYQLIPDTQQLVNGMQTGDLDLATQVNFAATQADQLKRAGMDVRSGFETSYILAMPQGTYETRNTPLKDVRVRQAMNYAVNRAAIARGVFGDYARPNSQLFTVGSLYFDPNVPAWPYDVAKAKQLLAEAGYPNGFKLSIGWSVARNKDIAIAVQADLKQVGVEAEITVYEAAKFIDINNGKDDAVKEDLYGITDADLTGFGIDQFFGCGKPNGSKPSAQYHCNPQLDQTLATGRSEPDATRRRELMLQAVRIQISDVPVLYLFETGTFKIASPKVRGLEIATPYVYSLDSLYKVR